MKIKRSLILIAVFFSLISYSQTFTFDGINYLILSPTSVRVDANRQFTGLATIPSIVTYGGRNYTVDEILQLAFAGSGLTSITIPNTVTSIAKETFNGCLSLTSVAIPNSVNSIGGAAFNACSSLTSISIPNSVTSIGGGAFSQCTSLKSITIPNAVKTIENAAFNGCSSLTSVSIPNSVTNIEDYAFRKCTGLSSVDIPNSVTNIGYNAFSECTSLTSISIPNSVTTIGQLAFSLCSSLTSVSIPNSVTSLGIGAFSNCTSLASFSIPNSITTINPSTFYNCTKLNSISIPNSVTTIGANAFVNCSSLNSVTIPNTVTSIDSQAFSNCINLNLVTVNWSTPLPITYYVFLGSDLSKVTLNVPYGSETAYKAASYWKEFGTITAVAAPVVLGQKFAVAGINYQVTKAALPYEVAVDSNTSFVGAAAIPLGVTNAGNSFSVTSIYKDAFRFCTGLTSVTISNEVMSIGDYAFQGCSSLTSVNIPNSVNSIGIAAFSYCSGLTSVSISNSVTTIGQSSFENCTGLTSATIPNSVTSIGIDAFQGCTSLTSVTIPNSVTSIGSGTFRNCSSLASVAIPNLVTSIGSNAFDSCTGLTSITIPNSVTSIATQAFAYCKSLTSATIGNSVTSLQDHAFINCSGLTTVTVNWATPLSINAGVFSGLTLSKIRLNVPAGRVAAYDAVAVWTDFGTILEVAAPVVLGQKFAVAGINYQVTKAALPYEVAIGANTTGNSGRTSNSLQTGISGALIIPGTVSIDGNSFSVTSILANAFQNSTGLTTVTIPSSITNIGDFAFSNCSGLTAVTVNATTPLVINSNVFENITLANITLNIPAGTETAYKASNVWKDFKISTTLGSNIFSLKNNLKFYPNPTQSLITFPQEINNLEVFDIAGKKVKSFKNPSATYDVSNIEKGIYLLKGTTTEGISINDKLIKN